MSSPQIANATVLPYLFLGEGGYEPRALLEITFRACSTHQPLKKKIELRYNRCERSFEPPPDRAMLEILRTCRSKDSPFAVLHLKTVYDFSSTPDKTAVKPEDRIAEREFERLRASLMTFITGARG